MQRLTDTEAQKSQVHSELQDLQRQLSQSQEGEARRSGGQVVTGVGNWNRHRKDGAS